MARLEAMGVFLSLALPLLSEDEVPHQIDYGVPHCHPLPDACGLESGLGGLWDSLNK